MKVVLFNGSPRKEGNTYRCLKVVMNQLEAADIECEYVWFGMEKLRGCRACYQCRQNKNKKCSITDDKMNEFIEKIISADGIILGSPTYFANVSTNTKALIERAGMVCRVNDNLLKRKVGAAVVAARRGGAAHVFSSINYFFLIAEMIVVGSSYWNMGIGKDPGDVEKDTEGIETFVNLGKNLAYVLQKLKN